MVFTIWKTTTGCPNTPRQLKKETYQIQLIEDKEIDVQVTKNGNSRTQMTI